MATLPDNLSDRLRAAIESSGQTRYEISKATGVSESSLSRFMDGAGLTLANAELLFDHLGFRITDPPRRARKRGAS